MIAALKEAFEEVDVLLTSGSVSMGDRDMLKPILENVFKATMHFGKKKELLSNEFFLMLYILL